MTISEKAFAKINISLSLTGEKRNNYHYLVSFMGFCDFYDTVTIEKSERFEYEVLDKKFDFGSDDLILKTVKIFSESIGITDPLPVKIILDKKIPIGAGLGGGSSDSAAVIRLLDKFLNLHLTLEKKISIASKIGSDVPSCLISKPLILSGYDKEIEELKGIMEKDILLVYPDINISTADIFNSVNLKEIKANNKIFLENKIKNNLEYFNNNNNLKEKFSNDLEKIVIKKYSEVKEIKDKILESGAFFSSMTGSGSACFGFFKKEDILDGKERLENHNSHWKVIQCKLMGSNN